MPHRIRVALPLLALSMASGLLAALGAGACGSFDGNSEDTPDGAPEASPPQEDGGVRQEAAAGDAAVGRCDRNAPFGAPEVIDQLMTAENQPAAWLTEDELTVYLSRSTLDSGVDLHTSTRLTLTAPFGAPVRIQGVNSDFEDDNPTVTQDGLHLFFHSNRGDDGGTNPYPRLYVASRAFTVQPFSAPVLVGGLPAILANRLDPFVSPSGDRLYYGQNETVGFDQNIYMAVRQDAVTYTSSVAVAELNSTSFETQPILTADETVVYFTSNRDGGNFDIWRASRANRDVPFGVPVRVPLASSTLIDTPTWVSHDDCELWIARGDVPTLRSLLRLRRPAPP